VPSAHDVAEFLDQLLRSRTAPDYPGALNGLQLDNRGPIHRVAAAVDVSRRVIESVSKLDANLLIVHHGLFWGGSQRLVGVAYERLHALISNDIAVYSSHLPLDAHETLGNNILMVTELGLSPSAGFGSFQGMDIGLSGFCDITTAELVRRVHRFVQPWGGDVRTSDILPDRRSRKWALCTGAGASTETLREASAKGIDTLIVGEGPHHTAVDAPDMGLAVIYAGHYATETLGVQAITNAVSQHFSIPWSFVHFPTAL
jgi:dinuclear metal center YbgI/SA1388 family protein